MTYDDIVRFVLASNRALAIAGTDNRAVPLIEIAPADWPPLLARCKESALVPTESTDMRVSEVRLYGAVIRPKL